jgi:hypothetical protein
MKGLRTVKVKTDNAASVDERVEYLAVWITVRRTLEPSTLKMEALYFFRNVGNYLPLYAANYRKRSYPSTTLH